MVMVASLKRTLFLSSAAQSKVSGSMLGTILLQVEYVWMLVVAFTLAVAAAAASLLQTPETSTKRSSGRCCCCC